MAKEKTEHCDPKFNTPPTVLISYPPNGWTGEGARMEYVAWLSQVCKRHRRLDIKLCHVFSITPDKSRWRFIEGRDG
jgi:hypothetical protein